LQAADAAEEICRKMDNKAPAIDSKFRRVLVAANRAEQLMRGARAKVEAGKRKPTRVAMEEIDHSLVEWGYGPPPQPEPASAAAAPGAPAGDAAPEPQPAEVH
jgi:DNA-directed RNA polymerase omega subunit